MDATNDAADARSGRASRSLGQTVLSCVLMLGCIGLLVLAMVRIPRPQAGALPQEAASEVPDLKLRFVACDVKRHRLQNEPVLSEIKRLGPDYLLLQDIAELDARALAEGLKMQLAFRAAAGSNGSANAPIGDCVLSKIPLSTPEAAAGIGMWTTAPVGSKRILVASISAPPDAGPASSDQLRAQWQQRGSPPIVLAGRFPRNFADGEPVHLGSGWFDALSPWQRLLPDAPASETSIQILLSSGWSCVAGGTITGYELVPSWIDASSSAFATVPTTQAATQPDDD